ncbi:unnamed protein product [Haemonchus placei]|uniref:Uncharacterized protein n=1 Tax=Haemonchus placei TaxID=6290 RepID=A0A0N4WFF5_HAEPC|nr:unnamed protein product [Haemonchus placei]
MGCLQNERFSRIRHRHGRRDDDDDDDDDDDENEESKETSGRGLFMASNATPEVQSVSFFKTRRKKRDFHLRNAVYSQKCTEL